MLIARSNNINNGAAQYKSRKTTTGVKLTPIGKAPSLRGILKLQEEFQRNSQIAPQPEPLINKRAQDNTNLFGINPNAFVFEL